MSPFGTKRTWIGNAAMSAFDPSETLAVSCRNRFSPLSKYLYQGTNVVVLSLGTVCGDASFAFITAPRRWCAGSRRKGPTVRSYELVREDLGRRAVLASFEVEWAFHSCSISSKETNHRGENYHEGDCGDGSGRGTGRHEAGGAARAAGSDKRRHRSDSCVGIRPD